MQDHKICKITKALKIFQAKINMANHYYINISPPSFLCKTESHIKWKRPFQAACAPIFMARSRAIKTGMQLTIANVRARNGMGIAASTTGFCGRVKGHHSRLCLPNRSQF